MKKPVRHSGWILLVVAAVAACAPRLKPLRGNPAPVRFPASVLQPGHRTVVFNWELDDSELDARGTGAARVAAPDSARLDFFVSGGLGSGAALLIGDSLTAPGGDMVRRLVPPAPLIWASLGRLALPALPDTEVRVDGSVLRADIGRPVAWRITFRGDTLSRVERVKNGRIVEWLERSASGSRYFHTTARRSLRIEITHVNESAPFDASIWHPF
jgi:hypothetical protein